MQQRRKLAGAWFRLVAAGAPLLYASVGCSDAGSEGVLSAQHELGEGGETGEAGSGGAPAAGRGGTGSGGAGKGGSSGGPVGEGGEGGGPVALGQWTFDDCSATSTVLADSSGNGQNAVRSGALCGVGAGDEASGLKRAVQFNRAGDVVTIADGPGAEFTTDLLVSAWVNPTSVTATQVIVEKATANNQTFSLGIRRGRAEFSVNLGGRKLVTSSAPLLANRWSHVSGLFDGTFIFLFIDGRRVGQVSAIGELRDVSAPIRIGNGAKTGTNFKGRIDEVQVSAVPHTEFDVLPLACLLRPSELVSIVPPTSGVVPPETTVDYVINVRNNDFGSGCQPRFFFADIFPPDEQIQINSPGVLSVPAGSSAELTVSVTGSSDAEAGRREIPVVMFDTSDGSQLQGSLVYELGAQTGCFVRTSRELLIKHLSVVDDRVRTTFNVPDDSRSGVWSFARLMQDLAPAPEQASELVRQVFESWLTDQTINGFNVPARRAMQSILQGWPRTPGGELDLQQSPLLLQAILNRVDVRDLAQGHAGEGRFVFGVNDARGFPLPFTFIFEYRLPAKTEADVLAWARSWHALGALPFPSEEYNAALQAITDRFAGRNAEPGRVNGSALAQLRSNENALDPLWELREFELSPATRFLVPTPVKLSPDNSFDRTSTLADYVNANQAALLIERHEVPLLFQGAPFLGGSSFNDLTAWTAPGIINNEARHKFSLNTCNGCHNQETGTRFLHIDPRFPGQEARLSGFMTGITVSDPVTGEPRTLNDLRRRRLDLEFLVCPAPAARPVPPPPGSTASAPTTIAKGIQRTH